MKDLEITHIQHKEQEAIQPKPTAVGGQGNHDCSTYARRHQTLVLNEAPVADNALHGWILLHVALYTFHRHPLVSLT